jgi:hypothetical protein
MKNKGFRVECKRRLAHAAEPTPYYVSEITRLRYRITMRGDASTVVCADVSFDEALEFLEQQAPPE